MTAKRTFGQTWWGNAWIEAMERIDFNTNRLPRGKRYANGGMVKEIGVKGGEVLARVQGSRPNPYRVKIGLKNLTAEQKEKVKALIAGDPALASALALGRLPEEMLPALAKQKIPLLPDAWDELRASCTCPDWANPCKHLAAVYYLLAKEIDKDPFLVFNLRGMETGELLEAAGFSAAVPLEARQSAFVPYTEVKAYGAGEDAGRTAPGESAASGTGRAGDGNPELNLAFSKKEAEALFALLPDATLFYPGFKQILARAYKDVASGLDGLALGENITFRHVNFCLFYPPLEVKEALSPFTRASFFAFPAADLPAEIAGRGTAAGASVPAEANGRLVLKRQKGVHLPVRFLVDLFLGLPLDPSLEDNSPSARFLNVAVAVAQALARAGSFAPEVISDREGNFFVRYVPLALTADAGEAIAFLARLMSPGFLFRAGDKSVLPGRAGAEEVLSLLLSEIVARFCKKEVRDEFTAAFFAGKTYFARDFTEKQTAKAVSDWLAGLSPRTGDVSPVIRIELPPEANGGQETFQITVDVENKKDPLASPLPLAQVFAARGEVFARPAGAVRTEVARQITVAAEYLPALKTVLSSKGKRPAAVNSSALVEFFDRGQDVLHLLGIKVVVPKELQKLAIPRVVLAAKGKKSPAKGASYLNLDEILTFSWEVAVSDTTLTKEEFLALARSAAGLVRFKDSYLLLKPEEVKSILERLSQPPPRLSPLELLRASLTGEAGETLFSADETLQKMVADLTREEPVTVPAGLRGKLRPYQERGFRWLYANAVKKLGSCLADDMGLGKTVQVIALILRCKEEGRLNAPALVVCPTTLVGNWAKECARFAPSLRAEVYHGTGRRLNTAGTDVLITTYGVLRREAARFKGKEWSLVVLDEAQNIKNPASEQSKAAKLLRCGARIALSGTPVENRLTELWSIFDFLNPGYLGSLPDFTRRFALPIEKYRNRERTTKLRKAIAPFVLRRVKSDPAIIQDLPEKVIFNEYCYLTKEQAAMYQKVVDAALEEIKASEGMKRRGLIFKLITALKQICNHPAHYTKKGKAAKELSGKAEKTVSLLEKIIAAGEKALLFTQYKEMGDLLMEMIREELKTEALFFHGGLPRAKRDTLVSAFQESRRHPVLLISLKAGGTGLNLTAATNVIHYDLWWNPAVEDQATDRTYRIGQTRRVTVHRLITLGTFEEKIDEMLAAKKELAELTVSAGEHWITELSDRELRELFRLAR